MWEQKGVGWVFTPATCTVPDCDDPIEYVACYPLCLPHAFELADRMGEMKLTKMAVSTQRRLISADDRRKRQEQKERDLRAEAPGLVYYLRVGEHVKIGFTAVELRSRLRAYPPGSALLAAEPGSKALEKQRHAQFRAMKAAGREWFTPHAALDEHIAQVVAEHGDVSRLMHHFSAPARGMGTQHPAGSWTR